MEEREIIEYLRELGFTGLINVSPNIEELMVSWDSVVTEVNFKFNTEFTESQLQKILGKYNIRRRTPEQFYFEKTGEKPKRKRR